MYPKSYSYQRHPGVQQPFQAHQIQAIPQHSYAAKQTAPERLLRDEMWSPRSGDEILQPQQQPDDLPRPHLLLYHLRVRLDGRHEQYPRLTTSQQQDPAQVTRGRGRRRRKKMKYQNLFNV